MKSLCLETTETRGLQVRELLYHYNIECRESAPPIQSHHNVDLLADLRQVVLVIPTVDLLRSTN